ncbi:MAG: succinate--CoA ligase subunit alpha [Leptolinea sp.]|jgi:succinyl-CoA synthetase alpha subunit|nr:succinate--CoA ligase subunit alpha [Leptolinea sp.]
MGILIHKGTKVLIQGITGHEGLFHTQKMMDFGTHIVAGVTPGRGGEWVLDGKIPVFDSVKTAVDMTGAEVSALFVPARFAADAMYEAADAGISLIVCITEGIPIADTMRVHEYLSHTGTLLIGPNSPGILTPGESKTGIIPGEIAKPGSVGVVSRSGTLTYEVLYTLMSNNIGVSTCVGIGGDPIVGMNFVEVLRLFEDDPHTEQVVLIGEIGGNEEEKAADFISREMTKPVVALVVGKNSPSGKRMGHAGAIIEGSTGSVQEKVEALAKAAVKIAETPDDIPSLLLK